MKNAAEYVKRIRRLFNQLRRQYGKPDPPDPMNPLEHLILAILARDTSEARARAAYDRLRASMVDNNELRVTPANEVVELLGSDLPDRSAKARSLIDALNAVYDRQNAMDLSFLKAMSVREARDCLRSLSGVDEFAAARVVLFSLGGHAIPVDEHTAYVLRKEGLAGPEATTEEIQAFLERHVHASEAMSFSILLHRYASTRAPKPTPPKVESTRMSSARAETARAAGDGAKSPRRAPVAVPRKAATGARTRPTSRHAQAARPASKARSSKG